LAVIADLLSLGTLLLALSAYSSVLRVTRREAADEGRWHQPRRRLDRSCRNIHRPARSWSVCARSASCGHPWSASSWSVYSRPGKSPSVRWTIRS